MRITMVCLLFVMLLTFVGTPFASAQSLSITEFRNFATSLPKLPGRIAEIRLFDEESGRTASVAIATVGEKTGWRLFVFARSSGGKFTLQWKSGKLPPTFDIEGTGLQIWNFSDGSQGVTFTGCAAHLCGFDSSSLYSVLLYVPSKRAAFIATSDAGKVSYSANVGAPGNERYRADLDQLVKDQETD